MCIFAFHRDVVTNVSWSHNDPRDGDCSMLLLNHIPPEMFVDLDEINRHELVNTKVSAKVIYSTRKTLYYPFSHIAGERLLGA